MTKTEIMAAARKVFADQFGADVLTKFEGHPDPFHSLAEAKGNAGATQLLDSLDHVEFIMAIEDHFKIEIDDVTAAKLRSLDDVVDAVGQRIAKTQIAAH